MWPHASFSSILQACSALGRRQASKGEELSGLGNSSRTGVATCSWRVIVIEGGVSGRRLQESYKGHLIDVSVSLDGGDWHTRIFIYYSDGPQNMLVTFAMDDSFKTYDGAIKAGLAAAQKWVDGKMRDT